MIKRTLYQFDLAVDGDESRDEVAKLCVALNSLIPGAYVSWESAKSYLAVLRIEVEERITP